MGRCRVLAKGGTGRGGVRLRGTSCAVRRVSAAEGVVAGWSAVGARGIEAVVVHRAITSRGGVLARWHVHLLLIVRSPGRHAVASLRVVVGLRVVVRKLIREGVVAVVVTALTLTLSGLLPASTLSCVS